MKEIDNERKAYKMEGMVLCDDLSLGYEGNQVITGLNFAIHPGDYLLVVGENGSGKSTLMKGILGLLRPISGACHFHGLRQTEIGYLPQQTPLQKEFPASVLEVVLSGCLNRHGKFPFYRSRDRHQAEELMKNMDILDLKNKSFSALSGGQRQRVLLCRAMLATTKLLVLDEPVAGLDPAVTAGMYELIAGVNREKGIAVIMISHDIAGSLPYANCILHMGHTPHFFRDKEEYIKTDMYKNLMGGEKYA